eukprot:14026868-Alexandrium_andersonii.AAC.1
MALAAFPSCACCVAARLVDCCARGDFARCARLHRILRSPYLSHRMCTCGQLLLGAFRSFEPCGVSARSREEKYAR